METKTCTSCKETKPISEFTVKKANKDGYNASCKQCTRKRSIKHYKEHPSYYLRKNQDRRAKTLRWFRDYKSGLKCERCLENHIACLSFHHIDREKKTIAIFQAVNAGWSIKKIKEEMAKCQVLCENCHRKLHWEEYLVSSMD